MLSARYWSLTQMNRSDGIGGTNLTTPWQNEPEQYHASRRRGEACLAPTAAISRADLAERTRRLRFWQNEPGVAVLAERTREASMLQRWERGTPRPATATVEQSLAI